MRIALLTCFGLAGCATLSEPPLPKQPDAPITPALKVVVATQEKVDGKIAAAVTVAREANALNKPRIVDSELGVALSFLDKPIDSELALARQRSEKASPADYEAARSFGKKLMANLDAAQAKVEADSVEAKRVSVLKDQRIAELQGEIARAKQEYSRHIWTLTGAGLVVVGGLACAFASIRVGLPLLICGAFAASIPTIIDTPWFAWIAGTAVVGVLAVGIYHLHDITHTPPPPPDDQPKS